MKKKTTKKEIRKKQLKKKIIKNKKAIKITKNKNLKLVKTKSTKKVQNKKQIRTINKKNIKLIKSNKISLNKTKDHKLKVGIYGISGCAGCLLSIIFEDCFKEITKLFDIKAFPLIKEDNYDGNFDYVFIEGTVCFDEDILKINDLRKRSKYIVALGSCATVGGVPSIKNFLDSEKTMKLVYPVYNHLKPEPPTPIDNHIKVDYYLPQCPPDKNEIIDFFRCIAQNREFKPYRDPVCFECRIKGNLCLLTKHEICLGPITNGGCSALCPTNSVTCYGCRGPCKDANFKAYSDMIKSMGYTDQNIHDKMETFSGLQFKEADENKSTWLEK